MLDLPGGEENRPLLAPYFGSDLEQGNGLVDRAAQAGQLYTYDEFVNLGPGLYRMRLGGRTHNIILTGDNNARAIRRLEIIGSDDKVSFLEDGEINLEYLGEIPEIQAGEIPENNLNQRFLKAAGSDMPHVSHCVGKDGICKFIRHHAANYLAEHGVHKPHGKGPEAVLRGRQRKQYRLMTKIADELEELFFTEYPQGCTVAELDEICQKYRLKGRIRFPHLKANYEINESCRVPQFKRFTFSNVAKDHVEIVINEFERVFVDGDELERLLEKAKYEDERSNLVKIKKVGCTLMGFTHHNKQYVHKDCQTFYDPDHPYNIWVTAGRRYGISNQSPYYEFYRSATRFPVHWNNGAWINADELTNKGLRAYEQRLVRSDLYSHDMDSSYVQYKKCPYFRKFVGLPNYDMHDPPSEVYLEEEGAWDISSEGEYPIWGNITGRWRTEHLRHFTKHGFEFHVNYGMWSTCEAEIPDLKVVMKNGKKDKGYVIAVGMLAVQEKRHEHWFDAEGLLPGPEEEKLVMYKIKDWKTSWTIAGQVYAAASTQIVDRALEIMAMGHKIYGIKVDAILTTVKFPRTGLFKASEAVNKGILKKTIWCDQVVSSPPGRLPRPLITGIEGEHDLTRLTGIQVFDGAGGTGKTTTTAAQLSQLDPLYITLTQKLRDDKKGIFRQCICMAGAPKYFEQYGRPTFMVVDEIGLIPGKQLREVIKYAEEHGTRLFLIGDEAQIASQYGMEDVWEEMSQYPNVTFQVNRRAKNQETAEFHREIRELALAGDCRGQRRLICNHLRRASKKDRETLPKISYHGKDGAMTIDKFQGQDITKGQKTIIVFREAGGRLDVMPKIIYTMISRFENIRDIRYMDTTNITGSLSSSCNGSLQQNTANLSKTVEAL